MEGANSIMSNIALLTYLLTFVSAKDEMIMAALCNTAGHYIFALWFLSISLLLLFSSPNLSRRRLDVYHTSTHGVALASLECRSEM